MSDGESFVRYFDVTEKVSKNSSRAISEKRKRTSNSYEMKTVQDIRKIIADSKSRHPNESNLKTSYKFFTGDAS